MGGEFWTMVVESDDESVVLREWDEEAGWHGNRNIYDGFASLRISKLEFKEQVFESRGEADQFLTYNHKKWTGAWALKFNVANGVHTLVGGWAAS